MLSAVEEAARCDDGPALLLLDLDLQNAFPTFEWDSIREAVRDMVPSISAWTAWCHQAPADVVMPSGEVWTGERDGTIAVRSGSTAQVLHRVETTALVWCIALVGRQVWVGTERGPIAIYDRCTQFLMKATCASKRSRLPASASFVTSQNQIVRKWSNVKASLRCWKYWRQGTLLPRKRA